jgi:hypothetical protein
VPGEHPGAFADNLDVLLADSFDFESRLHEVPAEPGVSTWEDTLEQSAQLRSVASALPPGRLADLRARVEAWIAYWIDRPASYVVVVGRRRPSA